MFTLRLVTAGDMQKPVTMRDTEFPTKATCLRAIGLLGKLNRIDRFGRVYVVTPSKSGK
jgi:hypothetical protein